MPVAVVETDGGRLGTRQSGAGPGVHQAQPKEDKIACLVSMRSDTHDVDPQPEPPASFRDCRRVARLVQQFQGQTTPAADESVPTELSAAVASPTAAADRPPPPKRLLRTCVATMNKSRAFGPLVAAEAQTRGFYDAPRQAFLGDGQQYNWTIQRTWFPHFVPIADFLHVLCYLYRGAQVVGVDAATRWQQYEQWLTACWQGRVTEVVAELTTCQERLGRPPPAEERVRGRRVVGAGGGGVLPEQQPESDGLPALPSTRFAGDEQLGGIVGGRVQQSGEGSGQVLESFVGCRSDPPGARCGAVGR